MTTRERRGEGQDGEGQAEEQGGALNGPSLEKTSISIQVISDPALEEVPDDTPRMRERRWTPDLSSTSDGRLRTLGAAVPTQEAEASYREPRALRVQREGVEDLIVPLYPDRSYVFGRAPESTVVFPHDAVSRQHGRLSFREDHRWVYRDLNSRNHSFLGRSDVQVEGDERRHFQEIRASRDQVLEAGDVILLGNSRSRITLLDEVPHGMAGPRSQQGRSPETVRLERAINVCARHQLPVFLLWKSGTGKTYIAREIHSRSRLEGNFVILNCGRLPQDINALTSELLGHVKGAFTDASYARVGKLYSANRGTLFLDEVEFLPRLAQDFLVDVLEGTGSFAPLGAPADFREPPPRFRLISASKVALQQTGLRPDLTQRLATGDVIILPTLEERWEDIPHLVEAFLHRLKVEQQYDAELTRDAIVFLQKASWPGQIRELESTVRTVVAREVALQSLEGIEHRRTVITLEAVKTYLLQRQVGFEGEGSMPRARVTVEVPVPAVRKRPADLTAEDLREALAKHQGNKTRAAQDLGIAVNTLKARMKAFGLE
ncbi:MAG TPA: sigma 54-interacting transcriptional regulator [Archangium sp.]|nr:sigma 54-interacting transcriptional regulator [Archangium sp.]